MVKYLVRLCPTHFNNYIEPFAGSATLFFHLAPPKAIIGDTNKELINFYRILRSMPIYLHKKVMELPQTFHVYNKIRSASNDHCRSLKKRAIYFFYLNRLCFNGVYRTNSRGLFNVPMGKKMGNFPSHEEFLVSSKILRNAQLLVSDFAETVSSVRKGDFVYLDPPYVSSLHYERGIYGYNTFIRQDIDRLISKLYEIEKKKAQFMVTFDGNIEDRNKFSRWNCIVNKVGRTISGKPAARKIREELIIMNY